MNLDEEIKQLVNRFNTGILRPDEVETLEKYIEEGRVDLSEFAELQAFYNRLILDNSSEPSAKLNTRFYSMLAEQKTNASKSWFNTFNELWYSKPVVRWAYGFILVGFGLTVGLILKTNDSSNTEINKLSAEVKEMKEMMMLSLLEEESINDRLKAVSLSRELPEASERIISALLETLNNDENVNVRLSALEALVPYADDSKVRVGLVASIAKQESPLVQMGLAEMMLVLQEKRSVDALKNLLENQETPAEVKEKITETLEILI
ncbi:MAG: HEAT repeat domain-containing protein [Bacteroidota bacterium]